MHVGMCAVLIVVTTACSGIPGPSLLKSSEMVQDAEVDLDDGSMTSDSGASQDGPVPDGSRDAQGDEPMTDACLHVLSATCATANAHCGMQILTSADGCRKELDCGACPYGSTCQRTTVPPAITTGMECVPTAIDSGICTGCAGACAGYDSCGKPCGACLGSDWCQNGICRPCVPAGGASGNDPGICCSKSEFTGVCQ